MSWRHFYKTNPIAAGIIVPGEWKSHVIDEEGLLGSGRIQLFDVINGVIAMAVVKFHPGFPTQGKICVVLRKR
jgi:hypothetical protein